MPQQATGPRGTEGTGRLVGLPLSPLRSLAALCFLWLHPRTASAAQEAYPGDIGQAIAAVLVFLVLLVILGKWAWGPIVQQLKRREEAISNAIQQADKREKEANQLLEAYQSRLESVETEGKQMLARSRQEAADERDQILETARQEARKIVEAAGQDIERAKRQALRELHDSTARLATEIAGQVLQQQMTAEQRQRLLDESIEQIRKRAGKES